MSQNLIAKFSTGSCTVKKKNYEIFYKAGKELAVCKRGRRCKFSCLQLAIGLTRCHRRCGEKGTAAIAAAASMRRGRIQNGGSLGRLLLGIRTGIVSAVERLLMGPFQRGLLLLGLRCDRDMIGGGKGGGGRDGQTRTAHQPQGGRQQQLIIGSGQREVSRPCGPLQHEIGGSSSGSQLLLLP